MLERTLRRCCLPSYYVLGVDLGSEVVGFAIVGIHLKMLVGKGAPGPNALKEDESQIELSVMYCKGFTYHRARRSSVRQPEGSAGAAYNMRVVFCDVDDAGWAFVIGGLFGSVHVSSSR